MKTSLIAITTALTLLVGCVGTNANKTSNSLNLLHLIYSDEYPRIYTGFLDGESHTVLLIEEDEQGSLEVRLWKGKSFDYPDGVYTKDSGTFEKKYEGFIADSVFKSENGKEIAIYGWLPLKKEGKIRNTMYHSIIFISKSTGYHPKVFFGDDDQN